MSDKSNQVSDKLNLVAGKKNRLLHFIAEYITHKFSVGQVKSIFGLWNLEWKLKLNVKLSVYDDKIDSQTKYSSNESCFVFN